MQPKKSLGQNFLRDKEVLQKIIKAANLNSNDNVIEVGPGQGILTKQLIKNSKRVIAIEIDKNLANKLKEIKKNNPRLIIINDDILKINLPELISKNSFKSYKVVANIPYYITSPIIQLFLETTVPPKEMFLMIQKEVAERICAQPGQMSILSNSVQYYAQPKILFYVNKKSFYPMPEVDSAVIQIKHSFKEINSEKRDVFFRILRAGFAAKRKTISNNLSNSLHIDKKVVEKKLEKIKIAPNRRAQELSVEDWKKISSLFKKTESLS